MYKYKNTTDVEVGDLVMWTKLPHTISNRLNNKVYKVTGESCDHNPIILNEHGKESLYAVGYGFKVLQTKPASEAVVGDYMYRMSHGTDTFPQHSVIKITRTDINRLSYSEEFGVDFYEVIVIAQAEQTSQYPVFKEDRVLGFIFKYTGPNEGIYLTNKGIPKRKPGDYSSAMIPIHNTGWKPCDFTVQPDIDDIDWWQARFEAGLPVYATDSTGTCLCDGIGPQRWKQTYSDIIFSMIDLSIEDKTRWYNTKFLNLYNKGYELEYRFTSLIKSGITWNSLNNVSNYHPAKQFIDKDCEYRLKQRQPKIKEQPMKLQQLLDTIFGVSDYEAKPKFIVTVFSNEKEIATTTANSVEKIQQTIQSDTRLWGCKLVAYKIHSELQTQVPVTITKFNKESNVSAE